MAKTNTNADRDTELETKPAHNEIRVARERRQRPAPAPAPKTTTSSTAPANSKSGAAAPADALGKFIQVGKKYYFRDGATAFEDRGKRLTTPSENTEVIATLLAIAQHRGWQRLIVSGSERFRSEAWRQAATLGLRVRGYHPTAVERARLEQVAARRAVAPEPPQREEKPRAAPQAVPNARPAPKEELTVEGRLLAAGPAPYRNDARAAPSYFVRVATEKGERTIWGRDLQRALNESISRPELGEEIVIRQTGREPVTVRRSPTEEGAPAQAEQRYRNRWWIESAAWMRERAALAESLRHEGRDAVPASPQLAQARLALRQAELMAERKIANTTERQRFVHAVREQLAQRMARGEAIPTPTLRAAQRDWAPAERDELTR